MPEPEPRIFVIGFNRCGTTSLNRFFEKHGIPAVHWDGNALARSVAAQVAKGADPVGEYPDARAFSDMESVHDRHHRLVEGYRYFKEMFEWHPTSYFILNTRPVEDWLKSRARIGNGNYLEHYARHYGYADTAPVLARWRLEWHRHHADVLSFFADKPRSLLVYDIVSHDPAALATFLAPAFVVDPAKFPHHAKGAPP
ncbi:MAG: sulfotransferase [Pseudomonadota bacterium]